ncbi:putative GTPase activating protein [Trypanosoma theileri]|uniref:Putative GTPase activating protein n=1 Tax=Trypanosoma theileri TaxID=67003 RepID=A0A1X0NLI5_9TRYP|nr:putative GTPase activating protein [Trypanosoma theileri]ORC85566.1 putative GTPase activating protein [Trypanosoma theileri]
MNFVADQPRPLDDFIAITGLKKTYAKECFDRFGGYAPALASFAQSYALLPKTYFDRLDVAKSNKRIINEELKLIYKRARKLQAQLKDKTVEEVWASYYTTPTPLAIATQSNPTVERSKKAVKYCKPSHFTGPLLSMPLFWKEEMEGNCSLINLNKETLEHRGCALRKKLLPWVIAAASHRKSVQYVEIDYGDETVRGIIKDAERTFFHPDHRKKFVAFLNAMFHEFKSYDQPMSYLAGLCLLVLNEEETAAVLRYVSSISLPPLWSMEVVGYTTAALVVQNLIQTPSSLCISDDKDENTSMYSILKSILKVFCVETVNAKEMFGFFELLMKEIQGFSKIENQKVH